MPEVHRIMKNKVEKKLDFLLTMKQGLKKKKKEFGGFDPALKCVTHRIMQ